MVDDHHEPLLDREPRQWHPAFAVAPLRAVDVAVATPSTRAIVLSYTAQLLGVRVHPNRVASVAEQNDAGDELDADGRANEDGAVVGLQAFVMALGSRRVQFNDAVGAVLPKLVRSGAVVRRLFANKVDVRTLAPVFDAAWG